MFEVGQKVKVVKKMGCCNYRQCLNEEGVITSKMEKSYVVKTKYSQCMFNEKSLAGRPNYFKD